MNKQLIKKGPVTLKTIIKYFKIDLEIASREGRYDMDDYKYRLWDEYYVTYLTGATISEGVTMVDRSPYNRMLRDALDAAIGESISHK
jgi:hypothetical protein